jgi:fatty acid-binding protein DegV
MSCICNKHKACQILGQCAKQHPIIRDNTEALQDLNRVSRLSHVLQVFYKYTKERTLIGSYKGKGEYIYPNKHEIKGKNVQEKIRKSIKKESTSHKIDSPDSEALKRIAEIDIQFGYIYDESERGNFHIIDD